MPPALVRPHDRTDIKAINQDRECGPDLVMRKQLSTLLQLPSSRHNKIHNDATGSAGPPSSTIPRSTVTPIKTSPERPAIEASEADPASSFQFLQRTQTFADLKGEDGASLQRDGSWAIIKPLGLRRLLKDAPRSSSEPNQVANERRGGMQHYEGTHHISAESLQSSKWVIQPRSTWKVRWDLWIGVIIAYSVVLVPYRIGFGIELQHWEQRMNYVFDSSFGIDVIFNFFTGYYDEDVFVHELGKIRTRYLRTWFLFDIASTIPFDQLLQFLTSSASSSLLTLKLLRTVRLFRLLKLMRLLRLKRTIEVVKMDALNAHVLQTAKSLMLIIFITHLVSCGWYMFYTWDPTGVNWVNILHPDGLQSPYLVSFYWASNTMMSVGYGDVFGVTDVERLYCIGVACLGSVCVGMIIANIQMLTDNYNPRGVTLKLKLQETKEFLLKRGIPRRLRQRVLSQYEYHWSRRTVFDEDRLLRNFPKSLQYEILAASMEFFVKRFPLFGVASVDFFVYTVPRLRPIVLSAGQNLVDAESVWEELYFVTDGSVETIRANIIVGSLAPGDICGIEYLVSKHKRYMHTYRSVQKTELYSLHTSELLEAIKKCPIAHKYLIDLATILAARYEESARRGRRVLQKQRALRSVQQSSRAKQEPFLQYRHRKSTASPHVSVVEAGNVRKANMMAPVQDEFHTHWSVIRHYSKWRIIWDLLTSALVLWTAVSVPFRIAFDVADTDTLYAIDRITDVLFMFDVMLSFVTTYIDDTGVEIVDHRQIRAHYLKTTFFVDVASTIPFDLLVEAVGSSLRSLRLIRTIKLAKLLRLVRLSKLLRKNAQWASELDISVDTVRLLKLLAPVLMIAHYVGCFWYYISAGVTDSRNAWWGRIHLDRPDSMYSKYIASVYWAIVTMTTVGFGDISAANSEEQAYSIFVFIGGTTLFAYVVGTVIEVVSNSKSLMNRERVMGQRVNAYIKERGVSNEFILACQEHLRFVNGEKTLFNEHTLFDALSYSLRSELILFLNTGVLSNVRFFDKKPKWFLTLVLPQLVPQYFMAGDLLIYQGNPVSGIFFIVSGSVVVKSVVKQRPHADKDNASGSSNGRRDQHFSTREGTIARLYEGEFFGYKEVLTQATANYNVFAQRPTGIYLLPREFLDSFAISFPQVMAEVRALILNSINKQQRLVHHWQNNDAIGISGEDREILQRLGSIKQQLTSRLDSFQETVRRSEPSEVHNSPRSASASDGMGRPKSGGRIKSGVLAPVVSAVPPLGLPERTTSFGSGTGGVVAFTASPPLSPLSEPIHDVPWFSGTGISATTVTESFSNVTESQNDPRVDDTDLEVRHSMTARPFAVTGSPLRRQTIDVAMGRSRHTSVGSKTLRTVLAATRLPPPLKRYPSMPHEINEIVDNLLIGEGYTPVTARLNETETLDADHKSTSTESDDD